MQVAFRLIPFGILVFLFADSWAPSECSTVLEDSHRRNSPAERNDTEFIQNASAVNITVAVNMTEDGHTTTFAASHGSSTTQTFTIQPTCFGTTLPPCGHAVIGSTCAGNMTSGEICSVICGEGFQPVGRFYCAGEGFVGASSCELQSTMKAPVTKFIGTFEFIVRLRRVPGLGVAFRDTVLSVLADSLVVPANDILRLEVEKESVENQSSAGSAIQVSFEMIVRKPYWVEQITADLTGLDDEDSTAHQEIAMRMANAGYLVMGIRRVSNLIIFEDEAVTQVSFVNIEEPVDHFKTMLMAGAMILLICSGMCLLRVFCKWRKACRRKVTVQESPPQYQPPCV